MAQGVGPKFKPQYCKKKKKRNIRQKKPLQTLIIVLFIAKYRKPKCSSTGERINK
jgi:hypothetical protein